MTDRWGRAATLFEELSNAYSEFVENARKDQFFLSFQSHGRVVRGEDLGDLGFGIEDHDYQDAGIQVFRDFLDDLTPTRSTTSRDFGPISRRSLPLGSRA